MAHRFDAVFAEASKATGAGFDFLLATAKRESGLRTDVKAPTSSATGLFQFIEHTWLETMKEAGPALGYQSVANQIRKVGNSYIVPDRQQRAQILELRKDPKAAALMAGAYAKKNEALLSESLGRKPKAGELYAAHFLGAKGSSKLIRLAEQQPGLSAHKIFPEQAKANRSIFFDKAGQARSVRAVYENLIATVPAGATDTAVNAQGQPVPPSRYVDHLGDRFRKKSSDLSAYMAQKEAGIARPSRYGGNMDVARAEGAGPRPSRYAQAMSTLSDAQQGALQVQSSGHGQKSAPVNLLPDEVSVNDAELPVLPRRKPAGLARAGQRFVDMMRNGEAVSRSDDGQSMGQQGARSMPGPKAGLDLSAYLDAAKAKQTGPQG